MTTQATIAKSPTAAMLASLEAAELHVALFGHGAELIPWLRAGSVAGFELPDDVLAVAAQGLHLAELQQAHRASAPAPHQAGDVKAILTGSTPDSIMDIDDLAAAAKVRHDRAGNLLVAAGSRLASESGGAFAPHRDSLIRNELRHTVEQVLGKAAEVAAKLKKFAPAFSEADLLAKGTPKEVEAWRSSRELQATFNLLVRAWKVSWAAATAHGAGMEQGRDWLPRTPGGLYAWLAPDDVHPDALRFGVDGEVLRIATAPSAYQLLSPSDLKPLIEKVTAALPVHAPQPASWIIRHGVVTQGA